MGKTSSLDVEDKPEHEAFLTMPREVSKVFGTYDIVEEFLACRCFSVRAGWSIETLLPEDQWTGGIPVPNFITSFKLKKERNCCFVLLVCCTPSVTHLLHACAEIDAGVMESRPDEVLGPELNKEYQLWLAKLGGLGPTESYQSPRGGCQGEAR